MFTRDSQQLNKVYTKYFEKCRVDDDRVLWAGESGAFQLISLHVEGFALRRLYTLHIIRNTYVHILQKHCIKNHLLVNLDSLVQIKRLANYTYLNKYFLWTILKCPRKCKAILRTGVGFWLRGCTRVALYHPVGCTAFQLPVALPAERVSNSIKWETWAGTMNRLSPRWWHP